MSSLDLTSQFQQLGINESQDIASQFLYSETGFANAFLVKVNPKATAFRYHVRMIATNSRDRKIHLTESADDIIRRKCNFDVKINYLMLTAAYEVTNGFGAGNVQIVYDNMTILFTHRKIIPNVYEVPRSSFGPALEALIDAVSVSVEIVESNASELCLDDPRHFDVFNDPTISGQEERSLQTFFELLTSQPAMDSGTLIADNYFKDQFRKHVAGIAFFSGFKKNARLVRAEDNSPQIKLSIDAISSLFYAPLHLADSLYEVALFKKKDYRDPSLWDFFLRLYKNVKVTLMHNTKRLISLRKLSDVPISNLLLVFKNKKISVPEYFRSQYNISLVYPELPALVYEVRGLPEPAYFPLELLQIVDGQKFSLSKFELLDSPQQKVVDSILKENAVKPNVRVNKIVDCLKLLKLDSPLLSAFGVKVFQNENSIPFGIRKQPNIEMGTGIVAPNEKASFRFGKNVYINSARFPDSWAFVHSHCGPDTAREIIFRLSREARVRNVHFTEPEIIRFNSDEPSPDYWRELFDYVTKKECRFLMLLDSKFVHSHAILKSMEIEYDIITQHVTIETLSKLRSVENILNKINLKLGGLNYNVQFERNRISEAFEKDRVFVLGYDVSHPTNVNGVADGCRPSVVGVSYNSARQPHGFIGQFFYQTGLSEAVSPNYLTRSVIQGLEIRAKQRPNAPPIETCLIYRDGLSEGQFAMSVNTELPAIRKAFEAFKQPIPDFVIIIASKRHNNRIFSQIHRNLDNPVPGTIVQKGLIRYRASEFFLQSANPLQGTARPVNYIVIVNEPALTMDDVQHFSLGLCYSHQIVSSAISMPEPVYQAHELAKRGANNFPFFLNHVDLPRSADGNFDYDRINEQFTFQKSDVLNCRFTA